MKEIILLYVGKAKDFSMENMQKYTEEHKKETIPTAKSR